mmetsp:Transcript_14320/g.61378  ORF Transcript_14320/g.61378 Transcript_14320/m.61378 type:complete len:242 (+) Transcript_14320:1287-2012(+)
MSAPSRFAVLFTSADTVSGGRRVSDLDAFKTRTETYGGKTSASPRRSARWHGKRTDAPFSLSRNRYSKETDPRATHFVAHALDRRNVSFAPYTSMSKQSFGAGVTRKSRRHAKTCEDVLFFCARDDDDGASPPSRSVTVSIRRVSSRRSPPVSSSSPSRDVSTENESSSLRAASVCARAPLSRPSLFATRAAANKDGSSNPTACSSTSTSEASGSHAPSSPRRNADAAASASTADAESPRA